MVSLTEQERERLHGSLRGWVWDLCLTNESPVEVVEAIVAARVQAERDRLLARIEALADAATPTGTWLMKCVTEAALRALVAEERA